MNRTAAECQQRTGHPLPAVQKKRYVISDNRQSSHLHFEVKPVSKYARVRKQIQQLVGKQRHILVKGCC